jgi:hypothetical protein
MKVHYDVKEHRQAEGVIVLGPDAEWRYVQAETDAERRAIVEPLAVTHAEKDDDWVYSRTIEFGVE